MYKWLYFLVGLCAWTIATISIHWSQRQSGQQGLEDLLMQQSQEKSQLLSELEKELDIHLSLLRDINFRQQSKTSLEIQLQNARKRATDLQGQSLQYVLELEKLEVMLAELFASNSSTASDSPSQQQLPVPVTLPTQINQIWLQQLKRAGYDAAGINLPPGTPVLVLAYNRPEYLSVTLQALHAAQPSSGNPVFVSQIGDNPEVTQTIYKYMLNSAQGQNFFMQYEHVDRKNLTGVPERTQVYYRLSAHFKWAVDTLFLEYGYKQIILLQNDVLPSSDFFSYFNSFTEVLQMDKSLFCISAFQKNSKRGFASDPLVLQRSDSFSSKAWMLGEDIWDELTDSWPTAFWEDWVDRADQLKGRNCVVPELSRAVPFDVFQEEGAATVSIRNNYIMTADGYTTPVSIDKEFLQLEEYNDRLMKSIDNAKELEFSDLHELLEEPSVETETDLVVTYFDNKQLLEYMQSLGVLLTSPTEGTGAQRVLSAYHGVFQFHVDHFRLFFVHSDAEH